MCILHFLGEGNGHSGDRLRSDALGWLDCATGEARREDVECGVTWTWTWETRVRVTHVGIRVEQHGHYTYYHTLVPEQEQAIRNVGDKFTLRSRVKRLK
jgi:hypothetical protein